MNLQDQGFEVHDPTDKLSEGGTWFAIEGPLAFRVYTIEGRTFLNVVTTKQMARYLALSLKVSTEPVK